MYSARITRSNPSAFIFLIDQSGSMQEQVTFNGSVMTKAEAVALVTNMLISETINRSRREEGVRDYFHLALLGYSDNEVYTLVKLPAGASFLSVSQLAGLDVPQRRYTRERLLPSGESILTSTEQKFWVEPRAVSNTPMYAALNQAYDLARKWCSATANRSGYPPIIFNITDGEASDAEEEKLLDVAQRIRSLSTEDGNVLLINIHICPDGSGNTDGAQVIFPSSEEELGDARHAGLLYRLSSPMPESYQENIVRVKGPGAVAPFRGMSYNCSMADLLTMIDIGSISINMIQ